MPANRGTLPNWRPMPDFSGHNLQLEQVSVDRPKSVEHLASYILNAALPEIVSYPNDIQAGLATDIAKTWFNPRRGMDKIVDDYLVFQAKPRVVETMLVACMTLPDGSETSVSIPAQASTVAA